MAFTTTEADLSKFREPQGLQASLVGLTLASASTIIPTNKYHIVSGTTAIDTIQVPWSNFQGVIYLNPSGVWTLTTAGNVAIAVTAVVNKLLILFYNPVVGKWVPSYLS